MHHKKSTDDTKGEMGSGCVLTAQKGGRKRDDKSTFSFACLSAAKFSETDVVRGSRTLRHLSGRALRCVLGKYYV